MTEDSDYELEPLRGEGDFILYRGRERGKQMPILAVAVGEEMQRRVTLTVGREP
jgi:hypothetical protein